MPTDYQKEKSYNAITYFVAHTASCYKKKIYKLLWLLDSEHYQAIGRNVTGYHYFAWEQGPVPTELHEAIDGNSESLREWFEIQITTGSKGYVRTEFISKKAFDPKYFSQRELQIMEDLAQRFDVSNSEEMERFTHQVGSPWYQVWEVEKRRQAEIPYHYALNALGEEDREIILDIVKEREAFASNYK